MDGWSNHGWAHISGRFEIGCRSAPQVSGHFWIGPTGPKWVVSGRFGSDISRIFGGFPGVPGSELLVSFPGSSEEAIPVLDSDYNILSSTRHVLL